MVASGHVSWRSVTLAERGAESGCDFSLVAANLKELGYISSSFAALQKPGGPDNYIEAVANVMVRANWHTYQVLTKRSKRLTKLLSTRL